MEMLKKYWILIISLFSGILLVLLFFPRFRQSTSEKEVVIKFVDNISKAHLKIIENFNKANKNKIKVVPIDLPFYKFSTNERKEILIRALKSKLNDIDIFSADLIWVKRFSKWSEQLDKYFSQEEIKKLIPQARKTIKIGNHIYGIPLYLDVSVLFYRKDLLKKISRNNELEKELKNSMSWEKFISLALKSKFGRNYYIFPADEYEGLTCSLNELLWSEDSNFFANKIDFTDKAAKKASKFLVDLVNKYKISPPEIINFREKDTYNYFIKKDGLFLRGWQSFSKDTKNLNKSSNKEKYFGLARLPHLKNHRPCSTIGGWVMMLAKSSRHKKAAIKFMKFVLKENSQKILYALGSYLPVMKSVYQDSVFNSAHKSLKFNREILKEGIFRPQLTNYTRISDILTHYLRRAIAGEISVDMALRKTQKDIEKLRSSN